MSLITDHAAVSQSYTVVDGTGKYICFLTGFIFGFFGNYHMRSNLLLGYKFTGILKSNNRMCVYAETISVASCTTVCSVQL